MLFEEDGTLPWIGIAIAVIVVLGGAIALQQRHETDIIASLTPLCGERIDLAVAPTSSKFGTIGENTGVIDAVDPDTGWVSFEWIDWKDGGSVGTFSPDALPAHG